LLLLIVATILSIGAGAQQSEPAPPISQRQTINLAAGVPEYVANASSTSNAPQSQWWFENTNNSTAYSTRSFVESNDTNASWKQVGLPYDANIPRTFINQTSGGGAGSDTGQENWYRLHFKVDPKYAGQKFLLDVEGAHTGVQVFINGTLLPGISAVTADAQATHVVGFIPVICDLTPYVTADGTTDNVIAIDVSRGDSWFETPGFSNAFRFGQDMAGLFRNVYLYITNPVHIPLNVYSNQKTWGTYVGTVSEVPAAEGTATAASAVVEVQTNVLNETTTAQQVTLTTQIVDASGNVVVIAPPITQTVPAMTPATFPSGATPTFDQQITVLNPTLWYPNNSKCGTPPVSCGTPYLYKVYHIVSVNGVVVDSAQTTLGIRTITWDVNFPYFNGHAQYLWGGASRYDYPALGSSVPDEQWWRDMAQIAAQGGNVWRPGHSTSSEEMVEAADAYGIMIDQPSGDGEGHWNAGNYSADDAQLKQELHRDMIIRDRNHPSILDWERDNGGMNTALADELGTIETTWDNINPRVGADRGYNPDWGFMAECDGAGCEAGVKNQNPNNPSFGAEYWDDIGTGRGTSTGTGANTIYAYDYELAFAAPYLNDWRQGREANAFGMAQWYFAESPGEISCWAEFQSTLPACPMQNMVRSLGYSSTDANRFPRLLYYIYQANWIPYSVQPVVHLAHHWNRAYEYTAGTPIQENAFSNCPAVRLLINGVAKDPVTNAALADQTPNPWNINSSANLTQSTTVMPGQVHWMVNWASGTVAAECLDSNGNPVPGVSDTRTTAGAENRIVLGVVPEVTKPDGTSFQWTANGSDAAFVVAQVEDASGNLVPTAADNVTFSVSGPATYMGGTQQLVADPSWTSYYQDAFSQANSTVIGGLPYAFFHSPGDPELNFEGGLQKIALRSTFTPGSVTVTASAPGLTGSSVTLTSVAPPAPSQTQGPVIIVPPINTATTAGYSATFTVTASGSGTLADQWYENGSAISGATSNTYTTPSTTTADNGETFTVTVTSTFGSVTSTAVTLTVDASANVAITTQPASQTVVVAQSATLTVVATGSPTLTYQWYQVGSGAIAGATQSSYTTPVFTATGTESFYVVVGNPLGTVQSSTAVVTINAPTPVTITTQPVSQIIGANLPAQLTAVVAGSAPYTYQWQFTPTGGSASILVSNTQSSSTITYTIPAMSSANVGAYTVTVNNAANAPVTSAAANLTLAPPGVNLALDMTATSSSTQNACTDGTTSPPFTGTGCLGPENAVDGLLTTRWGSATAGAPPTPPVTGVDPSWLEVDLSSVKSFNTVYIYWENAYAVNYTIQYSTDNVNWSNALVVTGNVGGDGMVDERNFPTVQGRYIRIYCTLRGGQYGYSIWELQVYNVPQCGGSTERYTISSSNPSLVTDNQSGLTWTRTVKTDSAAGSQFTGVDAQAYCSSQNMRLPTESEALGIGGNNNATCAFPGTWSTWTSTGDPDDATKSAIVNFDGTMAYQVTNNYPGATLCDMSAGTTPSAPTITTQPANQTVAAGQTATFSVVATGAGTLTYQWSMNGTAITGATSATYTTPATTASNNGEQFAVTVTNSAGSVTSNAAVLTVTSTQSSAPTITTQPANQTVAAGQTATFSVVATGTGTLTYQWSMNGTAITGATSATYTTPATAASTNGEQFAVTVTNSAGSVTSNAAVLTVTTGTTPTPDFTLAVSAPSLTITAGSNGAETVTVTPQNGFSTTSAIAFACSGLPTGATCSFSPTTIIASGNIVSTLTVTTTTQSAGLHKGVGFWFPGSVLAAGLCLFSRKKWRNMATLLLMVCGLGIAVLTGCTQPASSPSSKSTVTVTATSSSLQHNATFSLTVQGPNATSASVTDRSKPGPWFPPVTLAGALWIFVRRSRRRLQLSLLLACAISTGVLTGCGGASVNAASVPTITTQPVSQTVTAGQTATFSVMATGSGTLTYQWYMNGTAISGATAATYTTPVTTANNNGEQFTVTVSNSAGSITSNAAVLTVTSSVSCSAVPSAPTGLTATASSSSAIALTWTAVTPPANCTIGSYSIYGSTTKGFTPSSGTLVATGVTGTSYSNTGLTASTTYYYSVEAVDAAGTSAASTQASSETLAALSAPTGLTATAVSSSEIDLSWTASTTAGVSYLVFQNGTQIATVTGTTYASTGLTASTTYSYTVEASDSAGTSTPDGPVSATTLAATGTGSCSGVSNITVNGATFTPQWCQEFNDTTPGPPDTTVWGFDLGNNNGWGNGEAEVYCGPPGYAGNPSQCPTTFSTSTAPVYVDGQGHLVIQPIYENNAWLSGRMQTYNGLQFSYGILEAGIELPNTTNQGLWPAFWTLGSDLRTGTPWPSSGEADIMENWSPQVNNGAGTTGNNSTIHTMDTGGEGVGARYTFPSGEATNTAFHTYGMIWTENQMQFFVDNPSAPFYTATPGSLPSGDVWPFNQTMFTILNVAVGGTLGGSDANLTNPGPMLVDYVRWYTSSGSGGGTTSEAPYGGTPAAIPGTVMAENYDTGGQGLAYDVTSVNGTDNGYRSDGVDLELASSPATGNDLGWTAAGQWFNYTVNVAAAGTYTVTFLVTAPTAVTDAFHIANSSGTNLTGSVNVPATGGYQTWTTVTAAVTLPAGKQILTLDQDNIGWNIDSMAFASSTPPAPPTALNATVASTSEINLSWTASTTAGVTYIVFQNGTQIASGITGTTYANTGLTASTTYSYTVEASDSGGTSTADGPVSATTLAGTSGSVAPPTSVTAVGSAYNQIDLRWVASTTPAPNTAPVNYQIYRSTTPSFTPSSSNLIGTTIGITNYVDNNYPATTSPATSSGVQASTTYYYQVVAATSSGTSSAVATSAASLPATASTAAPGALTGLTAMAENANEIDLIWNSTNSDVGTSATTYSIYRSTTANFTPSASTKIGSTKSNWFQDALCTASTLYYYQVLASNSIGTSSSSTTVSATTPALNPNLWGGAPFWDSSNIPATPAGDTLTFKFLNRTNGQYTDDQITYTATINGTTVDTSIAANPIYAMGANSSGRMYFFLNDPSGTKDNIHYWDFIEFTVGSNSINMDTTRVDAFGVKIAFNLTCGDGTNVALGENEETFMEDRSVTLQRYANATPSTAGGDFQADLVYAPYRIIEPGAAGFNAGGADQNYYANYISDIWSFNGITGLAEAGSNGSGLGSNPDLSAAIFRHTAPISGTPEFNAAGDLTNQGMWGNPASFYQLEPYDHYAQWIEAQAINMQQYAFPYNDAGGYSSDIGCANPKTVLVAIGW
jgi:hypothetical protein